MRILRHVAAVLGVGLLAACGGTGVHGNAVSSTARQAGKAPPAVTLTAAHAAVPLITGGQAQLTQSGGQPGVSIRPAVLDGKITSNATATMDVGGDVYAVPSAALPYFGTRLDPRLFDISYLQRAGYQGKHGLPVTITWRHQAHTQVPGLTSATRGITTAGTITAGTGLAGALSGSTFAQVGRVSLTAKPGVALPAPLSSTGSRPGKLYGLTVNVLGRDGQAPDVALITIQNLAHYGTYYSVNDLQSYGQLVASVPAGQYAIEAYEVSFSQTLGLISSITLTTAQVSVFSDSQVTLDARTARPVNAQVPRAGAAPQVAQMEFVRRSADGGALSTGFQMYGPGTEKIVPPVRMYATPAPPPATGSLGFADSWVFVPAGTGYASPDIPYSYYLNFASANGIPRVLSHVVKLSDLAAVHDMFPSTVAGNGDSFTATPFNSWGLFGMYLYPSWFAFPAPTQRVDYYYGTKGTVWRQSDFEDLPPLDDPTPVVAPYGPYVTYHPGEVSSAVWGASPAVPVPQWQDMGVAGNEITGGSGLGSAMEWYVCGVCRQGQFMSFGPQMTDGNPKLWDPGALGSGVASSSVPGQDTDLLKFYANGKLTQVADSTGQLFPLLPGNARYEISWASTRSGWSTLGTSVTSDWTFGSGPSRASKLPSYEDCSPDPQQPCTYLPLVFASYDFADGLTGKVTAPGSHTFTITGFHQQGETGPAVTHATVQVSFDDGKTWQQAAVTSLGRGVFRVVVSQPAGASFASVRVDMSDQGGDALRQTIIHAWALASASRTTAEGR